MDAGTDKETERIDLTARLLSDIGSGFPVNSMDRTAAERLGVDLTELQLMAEELYGE